MPFLPYFCKSRCELLTKDALELLNKYSLLATHTVTIRKIKGAPKIWSAP